jgi:RNA polymerase sigma factor (sigma-70 family)
MVQSTLNDVLQHLRSLCATEAIRDLGDDELLERFLARREETSFAILVQRHGPMVLGVCRRVLKDAHAAEDAFQAAFLVLVRRSASIRKRGSLASWLHGVAQRIARRARAQEAAQRRRERRAGEMPRTEALDERTWQELRSILDEEIGALPERYRAPVVLCYLEGKSYDEAARELGWPKSSLASRLTRARGLLRQRLVRRGVTLSAAALAAGLAERAAGAALPALLTINTVTGATLVAAGKTAVGPLSAKSLALAEEAMKGMLGLKSKILIVLLVVALVAAGVGLAAYPAPGTKPAPLSAGDPPALAPEDKPQPAPEKPADAVPETFTYAGRVLDPDGKPLAGAKVWICGLTPGVIDFRDRTTTGPDGAFRFSVRRDEFGDKGVVPPGRSPPEAHVSIGATAEGCGAACVSAAKSEERESLTLWLPAEEVVKGRIIDLEGKPVAGVSISAYVSATRADKDHKPLPYDAPGEAGRFSGNILPYDKDRNAAVSDKDGRFTLRGLGRGWLYELRFTGPTVVRAEAKLAARPQESSVVPAAGVFDPKRGMPQLPLYGSTFTHVAAPCKPILGVVREKGSGKPLAGFEVGRPWTRDDDPQVWATTDKEGRYKLLGLPGGVHTLQVRPPQNSAYLTTEVRVAADQLGFEPVTFDIQVERQPAATGRVIDRATGKPAAGWIEYRPLAGNPNLKTNPFLAEPRMTNHPPSAAIDKEGRFLLPVLRGPGVLLVRAEADYLPARLEKADQAAGVADAADPELIDCRPLAAWLAEFHACRLIDVPEGKDVEVEIALTPGARRPLAVDVPDGKVRDTSVLGLKAPPRDHGDLYEPGRTTVTALADGEIRRLFLCTYDGQLAAFAAVDAKETGPVAVKLKPTGTLTGRVLDKEGRPISGVSLQMLFDDGPGRPGVYVHAGFTHRMPTAAETKRLPRTTGYYGDKMDYQSSPEKTDDQGRFRLAGVLPEAAFDLKVQLLAPPNEKGQRFITAMVPVGRATVKPGETLDLGDLKAVEPPKK